MLLVDCGCEGSLRQLKEQLLNHQIDISELTGIIISHDDIDHLGGLHEIKSQYPKTCIYSSQIEAPYISGELKSLRLKQAEDLYNNLPEGDKAWAFEFQNSLKGIKRVPVDKTFNDDVVFKDSIQIVNTPGHTPGHISIYFPGDKIFIANDVIVIENGDLEIANPQFALDLREAERSVVKIAQLEIETLYCYHGGIFRGDVNSHLQKLIKKSSL